MVEPATMIVAATVRRQVSTLCLSPLCERQWMQNVYDESSPFTMGVVFTGNVGLQCSN